MICCNLLMEHAVLLGKKFLENIYWSQVFRVGGTWEASRRQWRERRMRRGLEERGGTLPGGGEAGVVLPQGTGREF